MSLRISEDRIVSDITEHHAWRLTGGNSELWNVSWLAKGAGWGPLSRDEAITAMTLAEIFAGDPQPDGNIWALIAGLAGELALTAGEAQALITTDAVVAFDPPSHGAGRDEEYARLTADVVLLARREDGELCVLLIRRGWPPFEGRWRCRAGTWTPGKTPSRRPSGS